MLKYLINHDDDIRNAHGEYQHFTEDEEMRDVYERRARYKRDYISDLGNAEEKGFQRGLEKGEKEALLLIARKMKAAGKDLDEIASFTGISPDEIR